MSHFSKVTPRGRSHVGFIDGERPFSGAELGSASPRAAWSGGLDRKLSVVVPLPHSPCPVWESTVRTLSPTAPLQTGGHRPVHRPERRGMDC